MPVTTALPPGAQERTIERRSTTPGRSRATSSSRHRLRESDLIVRRVGAGRIGGPTELHAKKDRIAPRIVETVAHDDPLLNLVVGDGDVVPCRQIGPPPLEVTDHFAVPKPRRSRA